MSNEEKPLNARAQEDIEEVNLRPQFRPAYVHPLDTESYINQMLPKTVDLSKAIKLDGDKARWDLLPYDALTEIVEVLTLGAKKYEPRNWEKGLHYSRCFAAAQRHLTAWYQNREATDPDCKRHHLACAACEVLFLLAYELREMNHTKIAEGRMDDRPTSKK